MLREPRLEVFYSPPKFDLKLNYDNEKAEEEQDDIQAWPDTNHLFGGDPDYQSLITDLMEYITSSVEEVVDYSQVMCLSPYTVKPCG